ASGTGPVEIRPLANAAEDEVENLSELDVVFRDYLSLPGLYRVATIPGERDPDSFIEILRTPSNSGWRGVLAAAYAYAIPRRAFIVSATLRWRDRKPHFGVTTQIRRLPGLSAELETQWSSSFERALQRAAYAVGARILPQTRHCKDAPWTAWRGRV